jgi:hypothetical protein
VAATGVRAHEHYLQRRGGGGGGRHHSRRRQGRHWRRPNRGSGRGGRAAAAWRVRGDGWKKGVELPRASDQRQDEEKPHPQRGMSSPLQQRARATPSSPPSTSPQPGSLVQPYAARRSRF